MNKFLFFLLLAISTQLGCKEKSAESFDNTVESVADTPADPNAPVITPTSPPAATPEPAQNAQGVWHYTCPKGCAGGAGSAQPCAKCGTTLAHNQAYHGAPTTGNATPSVTPVPPPSTSPEPPQNAKGIWHYTCPKGCAGGAGSAQPCAKCGTTLAHNQAYHG